jgi:surface protein
MFRHFKILIKAIIALMMFIPQGAGAAVPGIYYMIIPVVNVSSDGTTLTFKTVSSSTDINIEDSYSSAPTWCSSKVKKVVFDSSFHDYSPRSTAYWFYNCSNLTTIEGLEYLKVDSVQTMDYMFYNCKSLTTLDLSGFNTSKLTSSQNMFSNCSKLTTIYGNSWNILDNMESTAKAKWLIYQANQSYSNYMFYGCTRLVGGNGTRYDSSLKDDYKYCHVDGGSANPGYFTMKGPATLGAYGVEFKGTLTLYYDTQKNARAGNKYDITAGQIPEWSEKTSITKAVIDDSFSSYAPTSFANLFDGCYELRSISGLTNLNMSKVTDISGMFSDCCMLESIDLSNLNTQKVTDMSYLFQRCFSLKDIYYKNLNTANVTNMHGLFSSCISLKSFGFNNLNTSNVTDMSDLFAGCISLNNLDVSKINTSKVKNMSGMFAKCKSLMFLDVSNFNTSNAEDMSRMFTGCNMLFYINLSNFNTSKVTNMSYMFGTGPSSSFIGNQPTWTKYYDKVISELGFSEGSNMMFNIDVSHFDTSNVTDMSNMFGNCGMLSQLDLCSFNTSKVTNMSMMFWKCTNLKTISVLGTWNTANVKSGYNMFTDCNNLVGGCGTTYDANKTDYTYAHNDGGTSNPGYLTMAVSTTDDLQAKLNDIAKRGTSTETNPETIVIPTGGLTVDKWLIVPGNCHALITGGPLRISPNTSDHSCVYISGGSSLQLNNITIDLMNNDFSIQSYIFIVAGKLWIGGWNGNVKFINVPTQRGQYGESIFFVTMNGTLTYQSGELNAGNLSVALTQTGNYGINTTINIWGGQIESEGYPTISSVGNVTLYKGTVAGNADAIITAKNFHFTEGATILSRRAAGLNFSYAVANSLRILGSFYFQGNGGRVVARETAELDGQQPMPTIFLWSDAVVNISQDLQHQWTLDADWSRFSLGKDIVKRSGGNFTTSDFQKLNFINMPVDREAYLDNSTKTIKLRAKAVSQMKGDANGDGKITVEDIFIIIQIITGNIKDMTNGNADVNNDGKVDIADIVQLVNNLI